MSMTTMRPCILQAWEAHKDELHGFIKNRVRGDEALADDLLQTIFVKALSQGTRFCELDRARAWLFTTARNVVIDHFRLRKKEIPIPEHLSRNVETPATVDLLAQCLPRALEELGEQDADILRRCDLEAMTQTEYARLHGLSVPGAKSRLQRARRRLQSHLRRVCQVRRDKSGVVCCFVPRPPTAEPNSD